ncbi:MAG: hypothetical protein M1817_006925 [Caeruleum heppii]|nr:MAG: hypothetical protein M1817_006925 [Caeruleum heppii]
MPGIMSGDTRNNGSAHRGHKRDRRGEIKKPQSRPQSTTNGSGAVKNLETVNNIALGVRTPSKPVKTQPLLEPRPDWHATELPPIPASTSKSASLPQELLTNVQQHAVSLLQDDNNVYSASHFSSTTSNKFMSTIMSSGTLSDKISALTLVVQESPLHAMKPLENLLNLARKRSRGQAVTALGALKDLLGQGLVLPADRKLRAFNSQPGLISVLQELGKKKWTSAEALPAGLTKAHLILWAFEDWLKKYYFEVLKMLESWCNDEVEYARSRAVQYVWELLKEKPEQEANLLRLLVNKLGDPDKKIASKTSFLILQLQTTHPLMKPIIISSIEAELLFRPGQSSHARYYAIITLNQTILSGKEEAVANKLLDIYFSLFVSLLKEPEKSSEAAAAPVQKLNRLGQVQGGGGKVGAKARRKANRENLAKKSDEELTEKMISAVLTGVNRAFPFARTDDLSFEAHLNTLFKVTHSSNFNTSIQALLLIQQLTTTKHVASDRFYRTLYESLFDPRLLTSSKQAMYLNLLFRSLQASINIKQVKAFVKRLLQIVSLHQPAFVCGVLYLVKELEQTCPSLRNMLHDPEDHEDEVEVFLDVDEKPPNGEPSRAIQRQREDESNAAIIEKRYDGRKRDPEHSNADKSCLWELIPLIAHYHPSVTLFATRLLQNDTMPPKPDLSTHTLIHFLDRFVYRNAKASSSQRGISIMQPLTGDQKGGILLSSGDNRKTQAPVNVEGFWRQKTEDVAVEEAFFHQYFNQVGKGRAAAEKHKKKQAKSKQDGQESDEDDDDDDEDEIWQALVQSRPEVEGSEGDSDVDLDDLGSEDEDGLEEALEEADEGGSAGSLSSDAEPGFDFDSEEDALLASEDEVDGNLPGGLDAGMASSAATTSKKRRKLKHLPTFASVEDYAGMMDVDEDG